MERFNKFLLPLVAAVGITACFGLFLPLETGKIVTERSTELVLGANTFPTTLNTWSAGNTISSAWANALEAKIGADSSAVVTSHDYKISALETGVSGLQATTTMSLLTSAPNLSITESQISDLGTYLTAESDPIWMAASSSYLSLSAWYATTTDQLTEGTTNLYQDSELTNWIDDVTLASDGSTLYLPTAAKIGYDTNTNISLGHNATSDWFTLLLANHNVFQATWDTVNGNVYEINPAKIDLDTVMHGDDNNNIFYLDASANKIGIGTTTPAYLLDVYGNARIDGDIAASNLNISNWDTAYTWGNHATAGYNSQAYASSTYVWASDWTTIDNYPAACAQGVVTAIGDTLTCTATSSLGITGDGTVTSVAMTVPTGLSISGSPITDSGTLAVSLTAGYIIPLSASTTEWATAYGWGNHASQGYITQTYASSSFAAIGGAFHDGFSDFVANEHIDWTGASAGTVHSTNYVDNNTTYTATGTLLDLTGTAFSLNEGTLADGKTCIYTAGTGIVCNTTLTTGTVTSVDMSVPTGLTIAGNPITDSGTLALSLTAGYEIPKTASTSNWQTAYGWGDHSIGGYLTQAKASTTFVDRADWTSIDSYPAACSAGQYVTQIGDTLTCATPPNTTYTAAGTLLDLTGTTFSLNEGTLTNSKYCIYTEGTGIVCNSEGGATATTTWEFATSTATAAQTTFNLPFTYSVGSNQLEVYVNGLRMTIDDDYTEASTTAITFVSGRTVGDKLVFQISGGASEGSGGEGTVTSVALAAPTGLTVSGSPVTTSGTLTLALTEGYIIPLSASTTNWNTAYDWGNHGAQGYLTQAAASTTFVSRTDWTTHDNYPAACSAGQYVSAVGDTLTCATPTNTTYTAGGTLLDLTGTTFSIDEGTLTTGKACIYTEGTGLVCNTTLTTGTVTSVAMTVPTGLSISGSPITDAGTLAVSLTAGYIIPLSASTTNWNTAYDWGNHASAGYLSASGYYATTTHAAITDLPALYTYPAFTIASSTWMNIAGLTSSSTILLKPAFTAETWASFRCLTDTGTALIKFGDGTNFMTTVSASTTAGLINVSSNNTFTAGEAVKAVVSNITSAVNWISCSIKKQNK